jgi:hypothetical protein
MQEVEHHRHRLQSALSEEMSCDKTVKMEVINNAIVMPLTYYTKNINSHVATFNGGVYYENSNNCKLSLHLKNGAMNVPEKVENIYAEQFVAGEHIFGGLLKNEHFGHFFAESLARLWAVGILHQNISSIVYYLRDSNIKIPNFIYDTLKLIRPDLTISIVDKPTKYERLFVPEQIVHSKIGFLRGSNEVKAIFKHLNVIDNTKPEKIYVSRTKLKSNEGGIICENVLEKNLENDGYTIFHPQEHTVEEQISFYASAKKLIFAEGSAFHAYVTVSNPEQKIYLIRRRPMSIVFDWQLYSFTKIILDCPAFISYLYIPQNDKLSLLRAQAEINFNLLRQSLINQGFITGDNWRSPSEIEKNHYLNMLEKSFDKSLKKHSYETFINY